MEKKVITYKGFNIEVKDDGITPIECYGCGWDFDKNINEIACLFEHKCSECCEIGENENGN